LPYSTIPISLLGWAPKTTESPIFDTTNNRLSKPISDHDGPLAVSETVLLSTTSLGEAIKPTHTTDLDSGTATPPSSKPAIHQNPNPDGTFASTGTVPFSTTSLDQSATSTDVEALLGWGEAIELTHTTDFDSGTITMKIDTDPSLS
jgi:hypothetical protein